MGPGFDWVKDLCNILGSLSIDAMLTSCFVVSLTHGLWLRTGHHVWIFRESSGCKRSHHRACDCSYASYCMAQCCIHWMSCIPYRIARQDLPFSCSCSCQWQLYHYYHLYHSCVRHQSEYYHLCPCFFGPYWGEESKFPSVVGAAKISIRRLADWQADTTSPPLSCVNMV